MQFDSLQYMVFLPIIVTLFYTAPAQWRLAFLLCASVYFYASAPTIYVLPLFLATLVSYCAGILIERRQDESARKYYLVFAIILLIGNLAFFKYANFAVTSFTTAISYWGLSVHVPNPNHGFPTGISFYTFLTIGYLIDVYRRDHPAEKSTGTFALYILFFPKLLAGPIERSKNLLAQLHEQKNFDYTKITSGMKLIAWGLFKKTIIANRAAFYVDTVYSNPTHYAGWPLIFAFYLYTFQIYCDFSGYTDIAVGSSRMMGYDLLENFRRPYLASSIREFWRRWHISLTTWLRDYLYLPLGGNRVIKWRWRFNIIVVFVLSGIWHGPNWTFLAWGTLHGVYYVLSDGMKSICNRIGALRSLERFHTLNKYAGIVLTFHFVVLTWIFFRANSITDALLLMQSASTLRGTFNNALKVARIDMFWLVFWLAVLMTVEIVQESRSFQWLGSSRLRWIFYYLLVMSLLLFTFTSTDNNFIYGRF